MHFSSSKDFKRSVDLKMSDLNLYIRCFTNIFFMMAMSPCTFLSWSKESSMKSFCSEVNENGKLIS